MSIEIERKFLVHSRDWPRNPRPLRIVQGYFPTLPHPSAPIVRVRTYDSRGYLTVKGPNQGIARPEFEYEIPLVDAEEMLELFCGERLVAKTRHQSTEDERVWIIDEFEGRHQGLVLAEIELESELEVVDLPEWAGQEVTNDPQYRNVQLAQEPSGSAGATREQPR